MVGQEGMSVCTTSSYFSSGGYNEATQKPLGYVRAIKVRGRSIFKNITASSIMEPPKIMRRKGRICSCLL